MRARARLCAGEWAPGPPQPAWGDLRTLGAGAGDVLSGTGGPAFSEVLGTPGGQETPRQAHGGQGGRGRAGGTCPGPMLGRGGTWAPGPRCRPACLANRALGLGGSERGRCIFTETQRGASRARRAGPGPGGRCGRASLPGWPEVRQAHLGLARGQRGSRGRGPRRLGERPACSPALEGNLRELPIRGEAPRGSGSPRGARPRRHPPRRPAARCTPLSLSLPSIARSHNRL